MKIYCFHKVHLKLSGIKAILGLSILLVTPSIAHGAFSPKLRKFLNPIHLNFSIGYGRTYYNNQTINIAIFEKDGNHYLHNPAEPQVNYLIRWFGNSYVRMKFYEDINLLNELTDPSNSHIRYVTFDGFGNTFPIALSGHIDILKKFRLELGGALYINLIKILKPDAKHKELPDYNTPIGRHYTLKLYAIPGFKLLENAAYTLLVNTQIGLDFTYGNLIKDSGAIHNAIMPTPIGIGLTLEKHISEYFSVFGRLLYENSIANDKFHSGSSNGLLLTQKSLLLQVGVTINCPEIPRCPFPNCDVEVKHKHSNKPYRGVSMFTGKNSFGYRLYTK